MGWAFCKSCNNKLLFSFRVYSSVHLQKFKHQLIGQQTNNKLFGTLFIYLFIYLFVISRAHQGHSADVQLICIMGVRQAHVFT